MKGGGKMLKTGLIIFGVVFILIGLMGFFNNPVLSTFPVNTLHNWIHIISGILALMFAMQSPAIARKFAVTFGAVYGLVAILGFIAPDFMNSLMAVETNDNILHVVLALGFLALGSMKPKV
jgi:hypothetical protein